MPNTKTVPRVVTRHAASTAQRDAARRNRLEIIHERNLLLRLLTATYPAHLSPAVTARSADDTWRWVVCVHLPTGYRVWKISEEDRAEVFSALRDDLPNDCERHTHDEKIAALEELVRLTPPLKW